MASKKRVIGYYLTQAKQKHINWECIVERGRSEYNLEFVPIDVDSPLEEQGAVDVLLMKWSQQLAHVVPPHNNPIVQERIKRMREFISKHPDVKQIDPIESQLKIMNRDDLVAIFNALDAQIPDMQSAHSITVAAGDDPIVLLPSLSFPVICKTLEAGGSHESHEMAIVFNEEGLQSFKRPVLIQEYINHNATIEKVFVVGDHVVNVRRPSLPNFTPDCKHAPVHFNSQAFDNLLGQPTNYDVPLPSQSVLNEIAACLKATTGLSLFGFDLIRSAATGKYAVIDINFFPGFEGVDGFEDHFLKLLATA